MRWERLQQAEQREVEVVMGGGGSGPGKRWGHTCNAIKEGRFLYVFGGYGKDNCQTNQVHVFDTGGYFFFHNQPTHQKKKFFFSRTKIFHDFSVFFFFLGIFGIWGILVFAFGEVGFVIFLK